MKFGVLWRKALDIVFPPKCAACGEVISKGALCEACYAEYLAECTARASKAEKASGQLDASFGEDRLLYVTTYAGYGSEASGVTERLVCAFKHRKNQRLADFFASDIASLIIKYLAVNEINREECVLAHLPRGERNLAKYGFDHAELLCERASRFMGLPHAKIFTRDGGVEQKKLNVSERRENVSLSLSLVKEADIRGKRVILIDDVITTGSTARRAAGLLFERGALDVICVVIAKTQK